MKLQVVKLSK